MSEEQRQMWMPFARAMVFVGSLKIVLGAVILYYAYSR